MRIEAYTQVQQAYKPNGANKTQKAGGQSFADQVQISNMGKDIQVAKQAVLNSPDMRESVMAPIRASVQSGTYQVNSDSFAEKLVEQYEKQKNL